MALNFIANQLAGGGGTITLDPVTGAIALTPAAGQSITATGLAVLSPTLTTPTISGVLTVNGLAGSGSGVAGSTHTISTGAGGGGNAAGGDVTINLGAGTGTSRNGWLVLNSTITRPIANTTAAVLQINATNSPSAGNANAQMQGLHINLITTTGANILGPATEAAEIVHTFTGSDGTLVSYVYGGEGTFNQNGASNVTQATGWQGNLRGTGAGTIITGFGMRTGLGPFTGPVTDLSSYRVSLDQTVGGLIGKYHGFYGDIVSINGSGTAVAPYDVFQAHLLTPSQGGNTSGTTNNAGIRLDAASGGAGVGSSAAGGIIQNRSLWVDVPNGSAAGGGTTTNAAIFINLNGNVGATNNYSIYNASTALSYFQGQISLGTTAPAAGTGIQNSLTLGTTAPIGQLSAPTFSSAATSTGVVHYIRLITAAAAFTLPDGYGVRLIAPSVGAGSAITRLHGINVQNQGNAGIGTSYGLEIEAQSGSTVSIGILNNDDYCPVAGSQAMVKGFVYIPGASGTPSGAPTNAIAGRFPMYYDSTANKLWIYNGSWRGIMVV